MGNVYYKITTSGLARELCKAFVDAKQSALDQINDLAAKYHATPDRSLMLGPHVDGLHFGRGVVHDGWRATRQFPGYCVPNKRSKRGREISAELDAIQSPFADHLAIDLGCPQFFTDFDSGQGLCASIGIMEHEGVYYLEANAWCRPDLKRFREITQIPASEWHKAAEDRSAAQDRP